MTSLSDYQLYWWDVGPPTGASDDGPGAPADQYVFETCVDAPVDMRRLVRVRTVRDLLHALPVVEQSGAAIVVGFTALLGGNLVAMGQWSIFLGFTALTLLVMVFDQLWAVSIPATIVLFSMLFHTLARGMASLEWLLTIAFVIVVALSGHLLIVSATQLDPRSHVLLPQGQSDSVIIYNHCCMDVKFLVFDGTDVVRIVPQGGLFGGTLVPRGERLCVGDKPPYIVKMYAPFETELGAFRVSDGTYSFRATAPALLLTRSDQPRFTNCTKRPVVVCMCSSNHWTSSWWLPFTSAFARLVWQGNMVAPEGEMPISGPCVLRVYTGLVGLARGAGGGLLEQAYCAVSNGERVDYVGGITWTRTSSKARDGISSLYHSLRSFTRASLRPPPRLGSRTFGRSRREIHSAA